MYINFVNEENKNFYVSYWLLLITFLVALMIVVGGLTRLTDSGLSITQWNLFTGIPLIKVHNFISVLAFIYSILS